MSDDEKFRKQMLEEILDFWEMYIYGNPTGSLRIGNNNETNLRHLKQILGISELERSITFWHETFDNKLSELKNDKEFWKGYKDDWVETLQEQITELKEQLDKLKEAKT